MQAQRLITRRRDVDREATRAAHVAPRSAGSLGDGQARHVRGTQVYQQVTLTSVLACLSEIGHARPPLATSRGAVSGSGWRPISFDANGTQLQGSGCTSPRLGQAQQNGFSDEDLLRVGEWVQAGQCWATGRSATWWAISAASSQIAKKWDQEGRKTTRGTVRQQQQEAFAPMLWQGGKR